MYEVKYIDMSYICKYRSSQTFTVIIVLYTVYKINSPI